MPRRVTLTDRQREALLHLPVDQGELLRHYTLSDEDLGHIRQRRRAHNRFGFALQLCVLRYPGRVLAPGELIPAQVSDFIAAQLGLTSDDLLLYAAREETRHEHLADLRRIYGYRSFSAQSARSCDFGHLGEHVGNGLVVVDDRPCEERRSAPIRERRYEPWRFEWGSDRLLEPEFFGHRVRDRQSGDGTTGIGG
ncbi:DUF4158 domain-containing protein, partial [Sphingobium yanoikuyae]|uniref:DUF4158 domain-containing protein n=1 Tax=Sphingobium yanoikuyae TaxID=13690 RepID=UPI000AF2B652